MLKELFSQHQEYLDYFFQHLDTASCEAVVQACLQCRGTLFFTGVGKSALIAKNIALTLVSTGTRALFISAVDALHGDLGMVSSEDLFFFLSKSGESDELLNVIPYVRNKGAFLIGIVSAAHSRLAKACNLSLVLPLKKELCPFDLAPTTSAAIQLIFGNVLTVALMRNKNFSIDEYALNHPGGRIGKRVSLKVSDLMLTGKRLPACKPDALLLDILGELSSKGCGCILVLNSEEALQGIFTDGDLRRSLQNHGVKALEMKVGDLMTTTPRTIGPQVLAWDAMKEMEADQKRAITTLPVIDDKRRLLGLIKMHDIIQSGL